MLRSAPFFTKNIFWPVRFLKWNTNLSQYGHWGNKHRTWWRHQMEIFSALLANCAGNSPVSGEFHAQSLATRSFDVFFDLRLNKRLSKQSRGWWFETLYHPLWRHCNECIQKLTVWVGCKQLYDYLHFPVKCQFCGYGSLCITQVAMETT